MKRTSSTFALVAAVAALALVALYSAIGFVLVPWLVERELPGYVQERYGAQLAVENVAFNPFLLSADASGLRLSGPDGELIASSAQLHADVQWSSLWQRGWRFDALRLDQLDLRIVLQPDGRLNLAGLGGDSPAQPGTRAEPALPQLVIDHARVTRGTVTFTDLSGAEPADASLRWIDAALNDITTITDTDGQYVISAVLPEGGALAWQGRVTLQPIATQGVVRIVGLQLPALWRFLREQLALAQPSGTLDLGAAFSFAYTQGEPALDVSDLRVRASGLRISPRARPEEPLLALQSASFEGGRLRWRERQVIFSRAALRRGEVAVQVSRDGTVDWQQVLPLDEAARETPAGTPFRFGIEAVALVDVDVTYVNRNSRTPMRFEAEGVDAGLQLAGAAGGGATEITAEKVELAAQGIRLAAIDGAAALAAARLQLQGGRFSLADREVVLPGLHLNDGRLLFAVDAQGDLNWTRLFAAADQPPRTPDTARNAAAWRIRLPGLQGKGMQVRYVDRSRVEPLEVQAGPVQAGLDLAVMPGTDAPVRLEKIRLGARALRVHAAQDAKAPALQVASARTQDGHYRGDELVLESLQLDDASLRWLIGENGQSNWTRLLSSRAGGRGQRAPAADEQTGMRVRLPGMRWNELSIHYRDRSRAQPVAIDVASLDAALSLYSSPERAGGLLAQDLRLAAAGVAIGPIDQSSHALQLASVRVRGGSLKKGVLRLGALNAAQGSLLVDVDDRSMLNWQQLFAQRAGLTAAGADASSTNAQLLTRVEIPEIDLAGLSLRYVDRSRAPAMTVAAEKVAARLALHVDTDGDAASLVADRIRLDAQEAQLGTAQHQEPIAKLGSIHMVGGRIDTEQKLIAVQDATLMGGRVRVLRDAHGRVMPVALFQADGGSKPSTGSTAQDAGDGSGWDYRIGAVALEGIDLSYADATLSPALSYETRIDSLALRDVNSRTRSPGTFNASIKLAEGGRLDANGKLRLDPLLANARVQLSQFDLRPLQPLLARVAALELKGGSGSADAAVDYRSTAQGVALQASGQVAVAELQIDEAQSGAPFLAWKQAMAESITYSHATRRLEIGNVRISRPRGKLEISEDRKLNVLQVLKSAPEAEAAGRSARTEKSGQAQADVPFVFRVDRLRLVDGTLHFADRSLVLPFERDIESFDATVVNLSSRPSTRARLEANGRIAPYGLAKASGDIDFSSPRDFTDIRAEFSNVRLPPLSPYSLTFAGRSIAAGTLWLDVRYRIVDGDLQGSNEVTIEDLELGERVEERTALNIPLDLAVALLTDEQGRFRISVPVRGDLDNPSFDYGRVIRSAITDTLRRVVTAPFRFIGRVFGRGGESLDAIAFQPGSAVLTPPQQDKLNTVAKALAERPQVALVVQPGFAPEADAHALRETRVKRELAQRAGMRLRPDEDPGPVAFSNHRVQRALAHMAEERLGRDALNRGAGGEDEGFYEMLYERLVAAQPLAIDPRKLAQQRTQSIVEYLLRTGEVDRERVAPADPRQVQATEDAVETELRLKAGGG